MVGGIRGALVALLLVCGPGSACAWVVISWNDCTWGGGLVERRFSCDTNAGFHDLVVVFGPDVDVTVKAIQLEIGIIAADDSLPRWWDFGAFNGCRYGAIEISTDFGNPPHEAGICRDIWWGVWGEATTSFRRANARVGILQVDLSAQPEGVTLRAGSLNYLCRVWIHNKRTIEGPPGSRVCSGCDRGVCITVQRVTLVKLDGSEIVDWGSGFAGWQGAGLNTGPRGCD